VFHKDSWQNGNALVLKTSDGADTTDRGSSPLLSSMKIEKLKQGPLAEAREWLLVTWWMLQWRLWNQWKGACPALQYEIEKIVTDFPIASRPLRHGTERWKAYNEHIRWN
jgi:hypothetical protein